MNRERIVKKIARIIPVGLLLVAATTAGASAVLWGASGHAMVASAAVEGVPSDMPDFFPTAAPRLAWLNPEPDRWRERESMEMDEAFKYDHYIDLENVPAGALEAPDRWEYLERLYAAGLEEPEQAAGFLPFRILEMYQRVRNGFARWRLAESPEEREWIEQRIIDDAGILGHYVADASNPHHSTIHFNGWAEDAPNPRGFRTESGFHWEFESRFVEAAITLDEVMRALPPGTQALDDVRQEVMEYIQATHSQVVRLYELEQQVGFDPDAPAPPAEQFAIQRLAAGADMLRALWYTAWVESAGVAERMQER